MTGNGTAGRQLAVFVAGYVPIVQTWLGLG